MKAGFFETDITPPVGTERAGSYCKLYLGNIHDPLKVRAAVFDNGAQKAALVGIDACFIGFDSVKEVQDEVFKLCGITPESIIIGASHTHSGAALTGMVGREIQDKMPEEVLDLIVNHSAAPSTGYREWCVKQIITAIVIADSRKEDALISTGIGFEDACVFNRRFIMKNGRSYTHPGKCNPDIVKPAGPVDPGVGVTGAWRKDGSLIGCVVNYACHGTCYSGTDVSADWIHYLEDTVRKVMGMNAGVVFLNGACGDVTQVNNLAHSSDFGIQMARKLGTRVGAEAVKVLAGAIPSGFNEISAKRLVLKIKRRKPSPASIRQSWEILRAADPDSRETNVIFAKERVIADNICRHSPVAEVPVHAVKIGNAVFVSNPAEYFAELGLKIKKASKFEYTFVVSLANGASGYVPAKESFAKSGGGYETVLTGYSNLGIDAGDKISDASIKLVSQMNPERVCIETRQPGTPWEYGVLGPDID
ncbi:MAG: hypothetical protein WCV67_02760 [Victivallaceae bacterium]|jgi:hypothetical protein